MLEYLCLLFVRSIRLNEITMVWREIKAFFVPKPGKKSYAGPKSFRPITLSTCTVGRSTDSALAEATNLLEETVNCKKYTTLVEPSITFSFAGALTGLQNQGDLRDFSKSAIINGVWIFYENTDYNQFEFGKRSFYGWGKDHKISSFGQLNRALSSVRSGFMGNEQYFYSDTPSLNHDNFGESIIVTGCDPWTLYEERSYRGDRICVYPASTQKCEPGFYIQPQDFGHFVNKVSSVRKGCFSKKSFQRSWCSSKLNKNVYTKTTTLNFNNFN
ncbi:unnamed protein product [Lepeophtheirus salmonis]|uniref:(salmon louse) hypothetical protein n=1 Tax=Lepeophtheirus salmonis TaxID=72036 RepID=A0A7R8D2R2_LEPSM|nr:unnamed protein product [Lepeophtheirus salmonis]CAF3007909.1 unnamed protein product [Lepeophtheirus salmonis]